MENQTFKTKVDSEENISPNKRKREPEPSFNDLISPNHVVVNQSRQENEPEESEEHPNILSPPPVGRRMRSAGSISVSEQLGTSGMEEFQNRMIPTEDEVNANDSTFIAAPSAPAVADDASVSSGVANPNHDEEESESLLLCHEISSSVSTPPGNTRVPSRQTCVTNCHCASTGDDEANDEALATVNILMTFGNKANDEASNEVMDNEADEAEVDDNEAVEDIANEADAVANDGDIANEADAVANDGNEGYDVGCNLVKYFQGHGWYKGEIKKIRLEAEKNKTRRVFYSDGDWEDLSIKEIKKARKSYANKLIQDRKKVTSNTNTSNEASKKTKKQKKKNCPSTNEDGSIANENEDDAMANENEVEAMANENDNETTTSRPRRTRSTTTSNETSNAAEPSRPRTRSTTQASNEINLQTLQCVINGEYEELKSTNSTVTCEGIIEAIEIHIERTLDENLIKQIEQYLLNKDEFILPLSSKKKKKTKKKTKKKRKRKKKARKRSNQTKSKRKRNEKKCQHPSGCNYIAKYEKGTRCHTHRMDRCQHEGGCNNPATFDNATRCHSHRSTKCQHEGGCNYPAHYDNATRCHSHRSARCQHEGGCKNPAQYDKGTRCGTHRKDRCQHEGGCINSAHYDKGTRCGTHRSARCQHEGGCNKPAVCDNTTRCSTHRSARCQHEGGCNNPAVCDNATRCRTHRSARCQHEGGCNNPAVCDNATRCRTHRKDRCQHEGGCINSAHYDKGTRCGTHRSARCQHEGGCNKPAVCDNTTRCSTHRSARCQHEGGCNNPAVCDNATRCRTHRSARCQHEGGCNNPAVCDNATRCRTHRKDRCQHEGGCNYPSVYDNATRCRTHRKDRCQHEGGCNYPSVYDNATRCRKHRTKRCEEGGCNRAAHFDNATRCQTHRMDRCQHEGGCNNPAMYDNATRCHSHRSTRCQHEGGCNNPAMYDNATRCHSHRSARCQHEGGCNYPAHYDNATRCYSHRSARCQHEGGCNNPANFGNATRCRSHREEEQMLQQMIQRTRERWPLNERELRDVPEPDDLRRSWGEDTVVPYVNILRATDGLVHPEARSFCEDKRNVPGCWHATYNPPNQMNPPKQLLQAAQLHEDVISTIPHITREKKRKLKRGIYFHLQFIGACIYFAKYRLTRAELNTEGFCFYVAFAKFGKDIEPGEVFQISSPDVRFVGSLIGKYYDENIPITPSKWFKVTLLRGLDDFNVEEICPDVGQVIQYKEEDDMILGGGDEE